MDFGKALQVMKDDGYVARANWDGKVLAILEPGANAKMTEPYIFESHDGGRIVPWCASHQELLATDWEEVEE